MECDGSSDSQQDLADCGEFGGWPYLAYGYLEKAGGIHTDEAFPYCSGIPYGEEGNCMPCMPSGYDKSKCGDHSDMVRCRKEPRCWRGLAGRWGRCVSEAPLTLADVLRKDPNRRCLPRCSALRSLLVPILGGQTRPAGLDPARRPKYLPAPLFSLPRFVCSTATRPPRKGRSRAGCARLRRAQSPQ